MNGNKSDVEKRLYWRRILEESATSGISMREFCRQRRLKETQSYRQRRMLKSGGAGTEGRAARRAREGKLCLGQRGVGVWQRFATKWATSPQIVDSMQLFRGDSFCESLQIRHSGA